MTNGVIQVTQVNYKETKRAPKELFYVLDEIEIDTFFIRFFFKNIYFLNNSPKNFNVV